MRPDSGTAMLGNVILDWLGTIASAIVFIFRATVLFVAMVMYHVFGWRVGGAGRSPSWLNRRQRRNRNRDHPSVWTPAEQKSIDRRKRRQRRREQNPNDRDLQS